LVASGLTIEQRRALQLLAEAPNGYTEAALRARGFTPTLLVELAANGYVVARPETMKAAGKTFGFIQPHRACAAVGQFRPPAPQNANGLTHRTVLARSIFGQSHAQDERVNIPSREQRGPKAP
jgi:hypothetical protein